MLTCEKCGKQYKDGNPRNNLIDNLEVLSSQVEHAKLHCKNGRFS